MSSSATATDDFVRTARATSAIDSRSQVAAFSKPVLESARASLSSRACRKDRCSKVTKGNAMTSANMLAATQKATRTATQDSDTSLYIGSLENCMSRRLALGSEPLIAVRISAWLKIHCTTVQATAMRIQVKAWTAGRVDDPCDIRRSRWKKNPATT